LELLNDVGIERTMLVGQSMGGYVCLQFAKYYPERVRGLVLVASHPFADSPERIESRKQTAALIEEIGSEKVFKDFPQKLCPLNKRIQNFVRPIIQGTGQEMMIYSTLAMAARDDTSAVISNAQFPTAFLLGEQDLFIGQEMQSKIRTDFPESKIVFLKNASHMIMMEAPRETSDLLLQLSNSI
jgi:pimeloyl-ACP methyl ester carboxylesterase